MEFRRRRHISNVNEIDCPVPKSAPQRKDPLPWDWKCPPDDPLTKHMKSVKTEKDALIAAKRCGSACLRYVPRYLQTEAVCIAAVSQWGINIQYLPEGAKTEAICLAAVRQCGGALRYIEWWTQTHKVCLEAVMQDGKALQYVCPDLQTSEMCKIANRPVHNIHPIRSFEFDDD
jgi:hypothetical protein